MTRLIETAGNRNRRDSSPHHTMPAPDLWRIAKVARRHDLSRHRAALILALAYSPRESRQ